MVIAERMFLVYEETCIGIHILKTTPEHITYAYPQTKRIVLQPAFLDDKAKIIHRCGHPEVNVISTGTDIHVRLNLPAMPETEGVIKGKEEHRL